MNSQHSNSRRNRRNYRIPLTAELVVTAAKSPRRSQPRPFFGLDEARAAQTVPRFRRRLAPFLPVPVVVPAASAAGLRPTVLLLMSYERYIYLWMGDRVVEQTFELKRGEDKVVRAKMDRPRSIAGWNFEFQVTLSPAGTLVLIKTGSISVVDAARGVIDIPLTRSETLALSASEELSDDCGYQYHIRRTDAGYSTFLAEGSLIVNHPPGTS